VTTIGWALSIMTVGMWWEGLNAYAGICPFPPGPAHLPKVGHPSCLPLCCFLVAIQIFFLVSMCLLDVFRHASSASRRFLPPFNTGSYLGSGMVPHSSSMLTILCLFIR
jgi:hypothetical protein